MAAKSGVTVDASGTANHIALVTVSGSVVGTSPPAPPSAYRRQHRQHSGVGYRDRRRNLRKGLQMPTSSRRAVLIGAGAAAAVAIPATLAHADHHADADESEINVKEYGATGGSDDTQAFRTPSTLLQYRAAVVPRRHCLCACSYWSHDIAKQKVKLHGVALEASIIKSPSGSTKNECVSLPHGDVSFWRMEDLSIQGNGNSGQHGMHFKARREGSDTVSGLWNSQFTRVQVYNFDGAAVWLEGGGNSSRDPIQFISFTDCILWRKTQASSVALLASGQVNQVTITNGIIEGFGASAGQAPGVSVKLTRQLSQYDSSNDASTGLTNNGGPYYLSSKAPHTWLFAGATIQGAQLGVFTDNAQSITFDTTHFEGLSSGIHASAAFHGTGGPLPLRKHWASLCRRGGPVRQPRVGFGDPAGRQELFRRHERQHCLSQWRDL